MGINDAKEIEADLQVGPTNTGQVRIYVATAQQEIPMDFDPETALEIAEEIRVAAEQAVALSGGKSGGAKSKPAKKR